MNDTSSDYARLFAAAVAQVVEDARWDARIASVRELAERAGITHTVLYDRFKKGVPFNTRDLATLAPVLGVSVRELMARAEALVGLPPGVDEERPRPRRADAG